MVCAAGLLAGAVLVTGPGRAVAAGAVATAYTGGIPLNMRAGASVAHARVGTVPDGRRLAVVCQVRGQLVTGHARRTDVWHRLASGAYVADANVAWRPARPAPRRCAGRGPAPAARPAARAVATVVSGGIPLNVRVGPHTAFQRIGTLVHGYPVVVACQVRGQDVAGRVRRTALWGRLAGGGYVSAAYLAWPPGQPAVMECAGPAPPTIAAPDPAAFIATVAGPARASARRHGVPASVTIAQAILESGWGRSELAYADRNYFGVKCFGGPGPVAVGCRSYPTTECGPQGCYATRSEFRVYRGLRDSVRDHGRFLAVDNPRYRPAFAHTRVPDRFAVEIHRAGYATAPRYATAIIGLMRQYNLYRYDR